MDCVVAVLALFVLAPLLGLIAAAVASSGPVIFRQGRVGLGGRLFQILKFRTFPSAGGLPTSLGRFLRGTSLDELPQLWNVLRGEMSLVGPRPQLARHLPVDCPLRMRRHDCLPGITGLAQVRGRNLLSWSRRFDYDLEYVDRRSFWLDLLILLRTVPVVLSQVGASAAPGGHPASEPSTFGALPDRLDEAA